MTSVNVTVTKSGQKKLKDALKEHVIDTLALLASVGVKTILDNTPKEEPGRMQAAWLAALDKLNDMPTKNTSLFGAVEALHKSNAAEEGDKSWQHGEGEFNQMSFDGKTRLKMSATLRNTLPFASIVESGGTINVDAGGNRGPTLAKIFPGQLDSPRSAVGIGFLKWIDESGGIHIERTRSMTGANAIPKAITQIKKVAKKHGFK